MATSTKPILIQLRSILDKIKGNKVLDAAALVALGSAPPPPLGIFLVNLYKNASEPEEDKTKDMIRILENLQKFSEQQFDGIMNIVLRNGEIIASNKESLYKLLEITDVAASKLDEIENLIQQLRVEEVNENEQIKQNIKKLENNILKEIKKLGVSKYYYDIHAEQLLFYLKLKYFLDNAYNIFLAQNKIAHNLCNKILNSKNIATNKEGLDDALYDLHKQGIIEGADLQDFKYIRKVTDDIEKFNWYAKELLLRNERFVRHSELLMRLIVHYSTWQAKYQLYKDDPNMCLIYVGPIQKAGFPVEINDFIYGMIKQLTTNLNLDN